MKKLCLILAFTMLLGLMAPVAFADDWYGGANDGDLLYTADFSGTDEILKPDFAPNDNVDPDPEGEAYLVGWNWDSSNMKATVDPADSGKVHIELSSDVPDFKGKNSGWGGQVEGLPLGAEYSYTVMFTVTRTANVPIGLLLNGHQGCYVYAKKGRLQNNGNALKESDGTSHEYISYLEVPGMGPDASNPSVQEFAMEVNGSNSSLALYVKDTYGHWDELDRTETFAFGSIDTTPNLSLYFYSYFTTGVDVSDVEIYKGVSLIAAENVLHPEPEGEFDDEDETGEGENETKEKTTYAPPKVVEEGTEAPAANEEKKGGCGSAIGFGGAMFIIASAGSAAVISFRRKKDD